MIGEMLLGQLGPPSDSRKRMFVNKKVDTKGKCPVLLAGFAPTSKLKLFGKAQRPQFSPASVCVRCLVVFLGVHRILSTRVKTIDKVRTAG